MNSRQQGLILFNTLMMISVLSLIVLSQMQLIFVQLKATNLVLFRHQSFQRLENEANRLVLAGRKEWPQECLISEANPNAIIERLKGKKGCTVFNDDQHYKFLVEDLGFFPCLQTIHNFMLYSTRHWRLTITAVMEKPITLQLRIARAAEYMPCVSNQTISINTGIISWRSI